MNLSIRQRRFLVGILRDRERYAAMPRPECMDAGGAAAWIRTQQCQRGEVRVNPTGWLGRPQTKSDGVMNSRCYKSLEAKGLIHRLSFDDSTYTSAVRLTEAGERIARELLAAEATDG